MKTMLITIFGFVALTGGAAIGQSQSPAFVPAMPALIPPIGPMCDPGPCIDPCVLLGIACNPEPVGSRLPEFVEVLGGAYRVMFPNLVLVDFGCSPHLPPWLPLVFVAGRFYANANGTLYPLHYIPRPGCLPVPPILYDHLR
jgi:hypothetical protein